jgi:anti-sigma factor RsiW
MRGKVSDQDLTDYAMNELPPDERLYVESMLGVSEECRADVYQMLDLGEMLKEGFEADERKDEAGADLLLNDEQRAKVLTVPRWNVMAFFRQAAAITLLGAGTAFALTRPGFWQQGGAADKLGDAADGIDKFVGEVREKGFATTAQELTDRLKSLGAGLSAEGSEWQFVATPAVCTPPMPPVAEM